MELAQYYIANSYHFSNWFNKLMRISYLTEALSLWKSEYEENYKWFDNHLYE